MLNNNKSKKKKHLTFQDLRTGLIVVFSSLLDAKEKHERVANYLRGVDTYIMLLETWHKSGLSVATILQRVNYMKLHYVRYLGGNPLSQTFTEVKVTGAGLPTSIMFLPLMSKDLTDIKYCLTVLTATRAITLELDPDIEPIVSTATGLIPKDLYEFTDDWIEHVVVTTRKVAQSE